MHTQTKSIRSSVGQKGSKAGGQRGSRSLSDRSFQLLCLISEQRAIRLDHLARFLGRRPSVIRREVDRLARDGYVEERRFLVDEAEPWVWLTRTGVRVAGTGYCYYEPKVAALAHMAAVNQVRLHVGARGTFVPERSLSKRDGRCLRHLPDAVVEVGAKRHAIEAEISLKWASRLVRILVELCELYDVVEYYCTAETRRELERVQADHGFANLRIFDLPE